MNSNQNEASELKRKWSIRDFWFLTAVIVLNFLLLAAKELEPKGGNGFGIFIDAYWFPTTFGLISIYSIFRFYGFLAKKLNVAMALIICCILIILVFFIMLFLLLLIVGTGHGGPLEFFYEKHLISLIFVTLFLMLPYLYLIGKIIKNKKK